MLDKISSILDFILKNEIKFLNFCFTAPSGRFLHITYHVDSINPGTFCDGVPFDGSSVSGWKSVESSDMILMPDTSTAFLDPFVAQPTLCVMCDVFDSQNAKMYNRDPRSTAKKAQEFLKQIGFADCAFFGIEMEFFIFEDARFAVKENEAFFKLDSAEGAYNSGKKYEYNNHGHRYATKDCYLASGPNDSLNDIRAEILETLKEIKLKPILHHHEVASSQCEVSFYHGSVLESSDNVQKCKHAICAVASSYGKSATFMPKPLKDDNGNGMHMHQSLWKGDNNLFVPTDKSQKISEICLHYIGGILKHAKALNAFTNPTTNSYKRLVSGYEAPTALAYSFCNRSAAIRIPYSAKLHDSAKRIEVRFPDTSANPYLTTSAMLMAGIDGIKNKINPGDAVEGNLSALKDHRCQSICTSLSKALESLDKDRQFLTNGNVFDNDQIDSYIKSKKQEIKEIEKHPSPIEFLKYYSI